MYYRQVLDNGIRVVAEKMTSVRSVSVGIWVLVGSRDEGDEERGISHFLEHMFFKGTRKRSSREIAQEIDVLGGELNAFTSRENTTFYTKILDEHLPKAITLMGEILHDSAFRKQDIEKEKQVVLEEFKMAEDDPEDLVHEIHAQSFWQNHPLGRPILGTHERIQSLQRRDITEFLKRHYHPDRIIISVAGCFDWKKLLRLLERTFGRFDTSNGSSPARVRPTPQSLGTIESRRKSLEQVHFCLGTQGLPQSDPARYAAYVLNTILGGGVSSRLFQEVRENRGLAYSIYSVLASYQDAGQLSIYAATSREMAVQAIRLVIRQVRKLRKKGVDSSEVNNTKSHIKGSIMLSLESTTSRMSRLAKDEIYHQRPIPFDEILKDISRVTPGKISRLAEKMFDPQYLALTTLGPIVKKDLPDNLLVR